MEMKKGQKKKKGFTLVELIVVLVILAILAAILIPALLGYIDRAREKKELLRAKDCLTMIQADFVERYALYGDSLQEGKEKANTIIGETNCKKIPEGKNGDVNATDQPWAKKILGDLDIEGIDNGKGTKDPYCIMFAVGSNYDDGTCAVYNQNTDLHDKYTVYYMFYMERVDSVPLFYFNGKWSTHHPRMNNTSDFMDDHNVIQVGDLQGKRLQYYVLSNKTGMTANTNQFWNWIRGL